VRVRFNLGLQALDPQLQRGDEPLLQPVCEVKNVRHTGHRSNVRHPFFENFGVDVDLDEAKDLLLQGVALVGDQHAPIFELAHVGALREEIRVVGHRQRHVVEKRLLVPVFAVERGGCRAPLLLLHAQASHTGAMLVAFVLDGGLQRAAAPELRLELADVLRKLILKEFLGDQVVRASVVLAVHHDLLRPQRDGCADGRLADPSWRCDDDVLVALRVRPANKIQSPDLFLAWFRHRKIIHRRLQCDCCLVHIVSVAGGKNALRS
jgi:hypothetical protein